LGFVGNFLFCQLHVFDWASHFTSRNVEIGFGASSIRGIRADINDVDQWIQHGMEMEGDSLA
jgi:hypothetical protein